MVYQDLFAFGEQGPMNAWKMTIISRMGSEEDPSFIRLNQDSPANRTEFALANIRDEKIYITGGRL